jgi:hypothetical protein
MSSFAASGTQPKHLLSGLFDPKALHSRTIARARKTRRMTHSNYSRQIADTICTRMSEGRESSRDLSRSANAKQGHGPWLGGARCRRFDQRYHAARQILLEYWADQILDIADDEESDPRSASRLGDLSLPAALAEPGQQCAKY